jgi:hypothetical protein
MPAATGCTFLYQCADEVPYRLQKLAKMGGSVLIQPEQLSLLSLLAVEKCLAARQVVARD